jgi:hypothetical protein
MESGVRRVLGGFIMAAALFAGAQANAAVITRTFSFTFTGFSGFDPGPTPVDPVSGVFSVAFDPDVAVHDVTAGVTVYSLNLPVTGQFAFSYTPTGELTLGAILNPTDQAANANADTNDFYVSFFDPAGPGLFAADAAYTQAGSDNIWFASTGTVTAVDGLPAIPEPSTWAMMLLGLGGLGAALRGRKIATLA